MILLGIIIRNLPRGQLRNNNLLMQLMNPTQEIDILSCFFTYQFDQIMTDILNTNAIIYNENWDNVPLTSRL